MKSFKVSTIKAFWHLCAKQPRNGEKCSGHRAAIHVCEIQIPDEGIYFDATIWLFGNRFVRNSVVYERRIQKILARDRFESFGDEISSFAQVSGNGERIDSLWVAKVLLLLIKSVRGST